MARKLRPQTIVDKYKSEDAPEELQVSYDPMFDPEEEGELWRNGPIFKSKARKIYRGDHSYLITDWPSSSDLNLSELAILQHLLTSERSSVKRPKDGRGFYIRFYGNLTCIRRETGVCRKTVTRALKRLKALGMKVALKKNRRKKKPLVEEEVLPMFEYEQGDTKLNIKKKAKDGTHQLYTGPSVIKCYLNLKKQLWVLLPVGKMELRARDLATRMSWLSQHLSRVKIQHLAQMAGINKRQIYRVVPEIPGMANAISDGWVDLTSMRELYTPIGTEEVLDGEDVRLLYPESDEESAVQELIERVGSKRWNNEYPANWVHPRDFHSHFGGRKVNKFEYTPSFSSSANTCPNTMNLEQQSVECDEVSPSLRDPLYSPYGLYKDLKEESPKHERACGSCSSEGPVQKRKTQLTEQKRIELATQLRESFDRARQKAQNRPPDQKPKPSSHWDPSGSIKDQRMRTYLDELKESILYFNKCTIWQAGQVIKNLALAWKSIVHDFDSQCLLKQEWGEIYYRLPGYARRLYPKDKFHQRQAVLAEHGHKHKENAWDYHPSDNPYRRER